MNIRKSCFLAAIFCLIFFAQACSQTLSATPRRSVSAGTRTPSSADAPILIETEAPTAAAEVVVPHNAPVVVYVKGGNLWLWGTANTPKQLTRSGQDSSPKISDDAQVITFIRDGRLWAIDSSGANERLLVSSVSQPSQFDFAPHTHEVYFNTTTLTDNFPLLHDNLIRVNADSRELRLLLDDAQGGRKFIFSPNGKKIALPRNDKINIVNLDGGGLKTVFTFPPIMMYSEIAYIPEIVWLPDSSGFKTVIPAQDQLADPTAQTRFMFISADGTIVARLAEFNASPAFANRPFISPDGSKVLYTKAQGTDLELHIIDASTADQTYFSHAADTFGILGWAPDSAHIVYWADHRSLLWLGPQQSGAVELSDVPKAEDVIWVDAQHYFFVTDTRELRFRALGQPSILMDDGLSESAFDFTTLH